LSKYETLTLDKVLKEATLYGIVLEAPVAIMTKSEKWSLIFLAIPFALKINDKDKLINTLLKFLSDITNDSEHIFATITCSLFINYALNGVEIEKWIENISEDLNKMKDSEKYIDYINNYYELNFRNNM
jgi:hypothetical protein